MAMFNDKFPTCFMESLIGWKFWKVDSKLLITHLVRATIRVGGFSRR
jgi:hypothetical protein